MHCVNCGTYVERGGYCFECGYSLKQEKSLEASGKKSRNRISVGIFWLAISYGALSVLYSATLATLFGIDQTEDAYPYNYWFQTLAVFFAALAAVFSKKAQFEKVPWMLFFALLFELLFRIYQFNFIVPVIGALSDFSSMTLDGYLGLAFFRLVYHFSIVGLLVAFVMSWFLNIKQSK
ncbi:phosphatidylglycerophosphatase A [Aurantimicrobium minutum]|uniref:hypothetical protein n=1 Tax=Aurantimicrobium minutum TaxID=708131 RepID=UPI0024743CFC|nr:hypothetical protein [Aurantimicrobium minutum]MDH6277472.1 phosphatidylglycerophosphatase A [Aurantimicrobium minutum]